VKWFSAGSGSFSRQNLAGLGDNHLATLCAQSVAVLPTLRFSREFGLVFCGVASFFDDFWVACFGLVLIETCLFFADVCFADCIFSDAMVLLIFQFTPEGILGVIL